jgi:putative hydrolase of the HAD superfamily
MNKYKQYQNYIFDLDDTLYPEIDYLKACFLSVSKFASIQNNLNGDLIYKYLLKTFKLSGRNDLYQRLIKEFNINVSIDEILYYHRNPLINELRLYPNAYACLNKLTKLKKSLFVITNGNLEQQKLKIALLRNEICKFNINVYFAVEYGSKPSPESYFALRNNYNINNKESCFVGNCEIDHIFAKNCGLDYFDAFTFFNDETFS